MSGQSFKSGSGDLDFGDEEAKEEQPEPNSQQSKYPYFIRRDNVGDERTTRLELQVRDHIAEKEPQFRAALADELDVGDVSKTDAREFALLAAFNNPELVAELMEEEGFGELD